MTTVTVTEDLNLPAGVNPRGITVTIFLAGQNGDALPAGYATVAGQTIIGQHQFNPAVDGTWSKALNPNADITPSGTVWAVKLSGPGSAGVSSTPRYGLVPSSGPVTLQSILTNPPGSLTPSALAAHQALLGVPSGHLPAGAIPNGQVLTGAGGIAVWAPSSGGSAVTSVNGRTGVVTGLAEASDLTTEVTNRANAVSTEAATRAAADLLLIPLTQRGAASGVATLGSDGKLTPAQVPPLAISSTFVVGSQAAMLALSTAEEGDVAVRTDLSKSFILTATPPATLGNWQELLTPASPVSSVNGRVGTVTGLAEGSDVTAEALARANADATLVTKLTVTAVKTSTYTAGANELVPCDTTAGAFPVNLPTAPANNTRVWVKLTIQGGTNAVTVNCGGSDVFNRAGGVATASLSISSQEFQLLYWSGIWYVTSALPLGSLDLRYAPIASPTFTGTPTAPVWSTTGITGAVAASRWVGATTTGAPVTGTFLLGDWIITQDGSIFICTAAGSPGTWGQANAGTYALKSIVDVFTSSGTWTKRAGLTSVYVAAIGAGGGGGSGRRGAAGTIRSGGGGGGGAGFSFGYAQASDLGATESVTVAAGGAGGAVVTVDNTDGAAGGFGGASQFGTSPIVSTPGTSANGGGGTATGAVAGGQGAGMISGGNGGAGSATGGAGAVGGNGTGAGGGGAGGGLSAADAPSAGGTGGVSGTNRSAAAPAGGTSAGTNGANGTGGATGLPGLGAGGGGTSGTVAGQGGVGIRASGGGGGGASLNGNNSGKGGNGGNGVVLVINYF